MLVVRPLLEREGRDEHCSGVPFGVWQQQQELAVGVLFRCSIVL